mmetsp:Transcript_139908/g.339967  ORF Transcript_139908/g.339967 Transcript_139908/m.339967 type:complete len:91 (+) Transcript_139908:1031-1303(+)
MLVFIVRRRLYDLQMLKLKVIDVKIIQFHPPEVTILLTQAGACHALNSRETLDLHPGVFFNNSVFPSLMIFRLLDPPHPFWSSLNPLLKL